MYLAEGQRDVLELELTKEQLGRAKQMAIELKTEINE
jgi:hypothetical protein